MRNEHRVADLLVAITGFDDTDVDRCACNAWIEADIAMIFENADLSSDEGAKMCRLFVKCAQEREK